MNFLEVLELAKKGKKIRLKKWSNPEFYLRSKQDQLYYSDSNKTCSLSISEYVSFDWEIYEGDEKLHNKFEDYMNNVFAPWALKIVIAAHIFIIIHAVALSFCK